MDGGIWILPAGGTPEKQAVSHALVHTSKSFGALWL
jgi:hypothetical protein